MAQSATALTTENLYRFSSKEIHAKSGMYYYVFRFCDPHLQRWVNRDPLQELGGLNLYVFGGNSPIDHFDPSGLWLWKGVKDLIKGKLAKLLIGAAAGWALDSCSEGCTDHSSYTACCGNVAAVTAIGLSAVASAEYVVCASLPPPVWLFMSGQKYFDLPHSQSVPLPTSLRHWHSSGGIGRTGNES